ncbi:hypothetical protein P0W64_17390 [Tsukamurella sp. 8F]|uniref:hypothetical protein n=1 Tax=unclassified Tsukamurella TaxID=2633480 RepID=UPI0023B90FEA|nr:MULTISPECIES: hypothetical protein [unclassified Tsukamurella]MDF0531353.1 hypothetical protein [Tsukamurella sp. 8J]MDF0588559.1 hypothetical protein [Tsukamurella sp. 8F]
MNARSSFAIRTGAIAAGVAIAATVFGTGSAAATPVGEDGFVPGPACDHYSSRAKVIAESGQSAFVVCHRYNSAGDFYYRGLAKTNGNTVTVEDVTWQNGVYRAWNNGYTYTITPGNLTIVAPNGAVVSNEATYDYRFENYR